MDIIVVPLTIATILTGLLAGVTLDHVVVQFPARRKLGVNAFADFKRAADTGNGVILYPLLAIGEVIFTLLAAILGLIGVTASNIVLPTIIALLLGIGILITTGFAAPIMLQISKMSNREKAVGPLIEHFIGYSYVRALLVWLDALVLLYALVTIL